MLRFCDMLGKTITIHEYLHMLKLELVSACKRYSLEQFFFPEGFCAAVASNTQQLACSYRLQRVPHQ